MRGAPVRDRRLRSVRDLFERSRVVERGDVAAWFFWWGAGRCVRSLLRRTTQVDRLTPHVHTLVRDAYAHLHTCTRSELYTYTPAARSVTRRTHVHTHARARTHTYTHHGCVSRARSRNRTETNRAVIYE